VNEKWRKLLTRLGEIADLASCESLLVWDQQTYMPTGGVETRAAQMATLHRLRHKMLVRANMGALLADLERGMADLPYDSFEASLLRVVRRHYNRAVRLPERLVAELGRSTTVAFEAWKQAKATGNFAVFRPHLERLTDLVLEQAEAYGYDQTPYDALFGLYEPDITTAQVTALFTLLRDRLVSLVAAIRACGRQVDDDPLRQHFSEAGQWQLNIKALELIGFDMRCGRLDRSEHPFTTQLSSRDVRLTTHPKANHLGVGLFSTLHEAGHGLYEQGVPWEWRRTPLAEGASLSVHESQSRLWENMVGRSRLFWQYFLPVVREIFPAQMAGVNVDRIYRAVNRVEPSLIRVDADEVTYHLHIFVRFELEQALLSRKLTVKDLPDAWNSKYEEYLGLVPPNAAQGVLQDVHWASGLFGYFPTYTLGTLLSVQIWQTLLQAPGMKEQLTRGRFSAVKSWLNEHVHAHGAKFTTQELAKRVTGRELTLEPYLEYIESKYKELYQLS
jgi:carboxypeptidase Taq